MRDYNIGANLKTQKRKIKEFWDWIEDIEAEIPECDLYHTEPETRPFHSGYFFSIQSENTPTSVRIWVSDDFMDASLEEIEFGICGVSDNRLKKQLKKFL